MLSPVSAMHILEHTHIYKHANFKYHGSQEVMTNRFNWEHRFLVHTVAAQITCWLLSEGEKPDCMYCSTLVEVGN